MMIYFLPIISVAYDFSEDLIDGEKYLIDGVLVPNRRKCLRH